MVLNHHRSRLLDVSEKADLFVRVSLTWLIVAKVSYARLRIV